MKKFLKLTTVVVSMVMALAFVSCANGNENSNDGQLNLVGTYGVSKVEIYSKDSTREESITMTMPTSTSIRQYVVTQEDNKGKKTTVEMDYTITKTANVYSFNWAKFNINGQAASDDAKTQQEEKFTDDEWNYITAPFAMTYTTTADGTWSNNSEPESSGTYTVDEANSKVTIITKIDEGVLREPPLIEEGTYSDNGKTFVIVKDFSSDEMTYKMTMTLTRK
ncbi:MAG: hypothetical protein KIG96_08875 [Treponema sp.]|nr:hypothetical protein [Treponema sp.]